MNPTARTRLRFLIEDAIKADRVFAMLMGEEIERSQYLQFSPQEPS